MAAPGRRRRFGQNFLVDPGLLEAIVRTSGVGAEDVVLEVGAGEGVLTRALAARARFVHSLELDRRLAEALDPVAALPNVELHWGDAMKLPLDRLEPAPAAIVSNLPYSVATPVIVRTLVELPGVRTWTVMVQREIAERLRASPGSAAYGAPSVIVGLAAEVRLDRTVDPAVFRPRPRVSSALVVMRRTGPPPPPPTRRLVREAFAHRRKSLARSLELARPGQIERVRKALGEMGLAEDARAEALAPAQFAELSERLGG
ncbi:MAG: 16S rRNA (adenine(1518)-N(6)/adenine(1519)-N(6))-dimethyltransferase RsmA [Solirubrobacterales bacterium]